MDVFTYLSMPGLKLIHDSKRGHWPLPCPYFIAKFIGKVSECILKRGPGSTNNASLVKVNSLWRYRPWSTLVQVITVHQGRRMIVVPNHPPPQDGDGASQWRHNERDGVSNHRRLHCLLNCWSKRRYKIYQSSASLVFVRGIHRWPLNSPQKKARKARNVSIWWRHHGKHRLLERPIFTMLHCMDYYEFWHASRYWILVTCDPDSARWRHIDRGAGGVNDRRVIPISDSF